MGIGNPFPVWGSGVHSLLFSDVLLAGLSKTTWSRPRRRSFHYRPPKKNPPLCNVYGRPFPSWRLAATYISTLWRLAVTFSGMDVHSRLIQFDHYHFTKKNWHVFVWECFSRNLLLDLEIFICHSPYMYPVKGGGMKRKNFKAFKIHRCKINY